MKTKLNLKFALVALFVLLAGMDAMAQKISGTVYDSNGKPLPGVSVFFKGTTTGAATDANGYYYLMNKNGEKQLVFSCLGMKEQEITIGKKNVVDVVMVDDVNYLDETVVIGYQTVARRDLMGAVASVDNKAITSVPATNFTESLSGKMAGVSVTTTEGDPDSQVQIRVRGTASITQDSSPLYIVDGFPVSSIADLSPQSIQSIDVLKDAFSTAIYGSRGAYGVVLITTKDAARGKVSLSYDGYFGIKRMANKDAIETLDPYEFARYTYEYAYMSAKSGDGGGMKGVKTSYQPFLGDFSDMGLYKDMKGNDWVGKIFDNVGKTQNHSVTLSGRTDKGNWSASYAFLNEDAIMINSSYKRHNINFRGTSFPVKKLVFSLGVRYSNTLITGSGANSINDKGSSQANGRLLNALRYTPIPMNYNESIEGFEEYSSHFGTNPLMDIRDNDDRRTRQSWAINGSGTWTIIPNLKLKIEAGLDGNQQVTDRYYGVTSYYTRINVSIPGKPNTIYTDAIDKTIRNTNTLSYDFKNVLKKEHHLDMLIGQEYSYNTSSTETVASEGFPTFYNAEMARTYRASAEAVTSSSNYFNEDNVMLSFFGRANYVYDQRYSISAAIRADASSKFAEGNRWGIFPSAAASWNIANERWLKNVKNVNQLKLRYSFGTAGNNRIPSGNVRTTFSSQQGPKLYGMTNYITPNSVMPNPNLKWETTVSNNIGIDFAFFKSRLSGTIEAYSNNTKDLLVNFPVSGVGYNSQYRNLGTVNNKGLEVSLRGVIVERRNWGINVSANVALNKNTVVSLGGLEEIRSESGYLYGIGWDYLVKEGEPLGNIYGYLYDGWYSVDDFDLDPKASYPKWVFKEGVPQYASSVYWCNSGQGPGTPKMKDVNGDGKIDPNDKVKIGNALPVATGGFNLNVNFFNFDLSGAFSFSVGNDVVNANMVQLTNRGQFHYRNLSKKSRLGDGGAWTNIDWTTGEIISDPEVLREVNKNATMFSPLGEGTVFSDLFVEDASYLRLNSLTLGYTIPQVLSGRIAIKKLRFYVTASNLFCLTNYSGYDPEVNTRRSTPLTPGVDCSAYPKSRSFIGGINLTF